MGYKFLIVMTGVAAVFWWLLSMSIIFRGEVHTIAQVIAMIMVVGSHIVAFALLLKKYNSPEYKAEVKRGTEVRNAHKRWKMQEKVRHQEYKRRDRQPMQVTLVGTNADYLTRKNQRSGLGRAILGGALLGELGAFIGSSTANSQSLGNQLKAVFAVKYESGRTGTEIVLVGSKRYEELIKYLSE